MKCFECKLDVPKESAIYEGTHYFHTECFSQRKNRQEFIEYVCRLFSLKAAGPIVYTQRRSFIENNGYDDIGMLKALRYAYEVKKIKLDKANERIGIIPYVYDEAQEYFKRQEKKQLEIAYTMTESIKKSREVIVKKPSSNDVKINSKLCDMKSLYDLED